MKANELRIGNFVFDDENKPMKVARVETQECTDFNGNDEFNVIIEHIDKNIGYYESKINPIPITEEWLIKFGFTRGALDSWAVYFHYKTKINNYDEDICVRFYRDGYFMYCNGNECNSSYKANRHVHQLQNLYFALTNEELIYTK
jgi:hypothetical protein